MARSPPSTLPCKSWRRRGTILKPNELAALLKGSCDWFWRVDQPICRRDTAPSRLAACGAQPTGRWQDRRAISFLRRPTGRSQACGTPNSPPARRLPPVCEWTARPSMVEGLGWLHSPIPASRAHGRRGALREPWIAAFDRRRDEAKLAARRARHRPVRCS